MRIVWIARNLLVEQLRGNLFVAQPVVQPRRMPMAARRHGAIRKTCREIAIVSDRGGQIIRHQRHVARGKQRLRRPSAGRKTLFQLLDQRLHLVRIFAVPRRFHRQIKPGGAGLVVGVGEPRQLRWIDMMRLLKACHCRPGQQIICLRGSGYRGVLRKSFVLSTLQLRSGRPDTARLHGECFAQR